MKKWRAYWFSSCRMDDEDMKMDTKYGDENEGRPFIPEKGFYQPSTDESWEAYQALISVVECQLGGFPRHVICGATDEVLSVLKSTILFNSRAKKTEMEELLGPITESTFEQLVEIGNWINDYRTAQDSLIYRPTSEETWMSYCLFLDVIDQIVGVQDQMVRCLVADGVLSVLKNDEIVRDWKKEAIKLHHLGLISDQTFDHLEYIGTLITDYPPPPPSVNSPPPPPPSPPLPRTTSIPPHLRNTNSGVSSGNFYMGPTVREFTDESDTTPRMYEQLVGDFDDDDDDDDGVEKEMVGPGFDHPTVKTDDDDDMVVPFSNLTVKDDDGDDADADADDDDDEMVVPFSNLTVKDDDGDELEMTDGSSSTDSEFKFEKVDADEKEVAQKSDVEDDGWLMIG